MTIKEIRQHKNNTIRQQIFTYLIHVRKEISSIDTRFFTVSSRLTKNSMRQNLFQKDLCHNRFENMALLFKKKMSDWVVPDYLLRNPLRNDNKPPVLHMIRTGRERDKGIAKHGCHASIIQ